MGARSCIGLMVGGRGALLTGDLIQVVADLKHVSFITATQLHPLPASAIERIVKDGAFFV